MTRAVSTLKKLKNDFNKEINNNDDDDDVMMMMMNGVSKTK